MELSIRRLQPKPIEEVDDWAFEQRGREHQNQDAFDSAVSAHSRKQHEYQI